jgi:uncharacterized protein (DUF305 family)
VLHLVVAVLSLADKWQQRWHKFIEDRHANIRQIRLVWRSNLINLNPQATKRIRLKQDQNREIEQMTAWYRQWYNAEVPASSPNMMMSMASTQGSDSTNNQEMPMDRCMGMMGMMNMDLEALKNAPDFDKAFIEQMIPHHKMAVMMAGMVLDSDRSEIRDLAKSIIQAQSNEIEQMRQWQQTWYR